MILDALDRAPTYFALGPAFEIALRYLSETDLGRLAPGRYEIDGARIFAQVSDYETLPLEEGKWEAHRRHIDVQYVQAGEERVGYACLESLETAPYDADHDLVRADGPGEYFRLSPDRFVIFFPQDAHMPGLAADSPAPVRKIVIKIAI